MVASLRLHTDGDFTPNVNAAPLAEHRTATAPVPDSAGSAINAINNAAQIVVFVGEASPAHQADAVRVRELLTRATDHIGALYLELIRVQRHLAELRATSAFLQRDKSHRTVTTGGK